MEWLRRLSVELLKESPSPALRSCWATAQTYPPLARYTYYLHKLYNVHVDKALTIRHCSAPQGPLQCRICILLVRATRRITEWVGETFGDGPWISDPRDHSNSSKSCRVHGTYRKSETLKRGHFSLILADGGVTIWWQLTLLGKQLLFLLFDPM